MARIMLIDDDVELADNTALLLRHHGHEVAVRYATEEALPALEQWGPDLLILDVMFPGNPAGGFDLARRIRQPGSPVKALPIILLTGINQELAAGFSALDIDPQWMPVQDFMEKPLMLDALLEKISRMLNPVYA